MHSHMYTHTHIIDQQLCGLAVVAGALLSYRHTIVPAVQLLQYLGRRRDDRPMRVPAVSGFDMGNYS